MNDDVDEVAVERACRGDRTVTLNRVEAAEAMRILDARGLSAAEIAEVLGISSRAVPRFRNGHTASPFTRPGVTVDNTKEKIAAALRSESPAIQRAAKKANDDLAALDRLLADWDAKALARERVAELEAELAKAKAALRGGTKKPAGTGEHKQAREWARANGVTVPDIGRVPTVVIDKWRQATGTAA